jgi:nucleoid-associated protein YgaU
VVRTGETLWSIAGDALGPGASPSQIEALVHRLWALNAARIGSGDPDLIRPGQTLTVPR